MEKARKHREDHTHHMWSPNDEEKLKHGILIHGKNWEVIKANQFANDEDITPGKCQQHWGKMPGMWPKHTKNDISVEITCPIEEEARKKNTSRPPPTKRPRFEPKNEKEDDDSSDSHPPSAEEIEKEEEGPAGVLGLIDRPNTLYTNAYIYYLWWKMPCRLFDFKVCLIFFFF